MNGLKVVMLASAVVFGLAAAGRALRDSSPRVTVPAAPAVRPPPQADVADLSRYGVAAGGPSGTSPVLLPSSTVNASDTLVDPGGTPFTTQAGEPMTGATIEPDGAATGPRILGITNGASRP